MAGRRTFFSFHYRRDVWRASNLRMAGQVDAQAAAGWTDASLWEDAKRQGDQVIRRLIEQGLNGTSVTAVLIGAETSKRRWVNYEIKRSLQRENGLLGVRIHRVRDQQGRTDPRGHVPRLLVENRVPIYNYDRRGFGGWVELAAIRAGHPCLVHGRASCWNCQLRLRLIG